MSEATPAVETPIEAEIEAINLGIVASIPTLNKFPTQAQTHYLNPFNASPEIQNLAKICRKFLRGIEEEYSFACRDGITFQGVEFFLHNRVYAVSLGKLNEAEKNGTLEHLCQGVIVKLRAKRSFYDIDPTVYQRKDLIREQNDLLWWIIRRSFVKAEQDEVAQLAKNTLGREFNVRQAETVGQFALVNQIFYLAICDKFREMRKQLNIKKQK